VSRRVNSLVLLPLTFINLLACLLYYIDRTSVRGYKGLKKLAVGGRGLITVGFIESVRRVRDFVFISIWQ
jgi:hypothetical protein